MKNVINGIIGIVLGFLLGVGFCVLRITDDDYEHDMVRRGYNKAIEDIKNGHYFDKKRGEVKVKMVEEDEGEGK